MRITTLTVLALATTACGGGPGPGDDPDATIVTVEGWADAPELGDLEVVANRDSVVVEVPAFTGAEDYRVIVVEDGVEVTSGSDGSEDIAGAAIFCAGRAQRAAPATPGINPVLRRIEITGLTDSVQLAVEAIDRECPFAGVIGPTHQEHETSDVAQAEGAGPTFPIVTEDEIRARHGSLIVNGHGPSTALGMPADPVTPRVLARSFVVVTPTGTAGTPPMAFWDDFSDDTDGFTQVGRYDLHGGYQDGTHWASSKWNLYAMGISAGRTGDDVIPPQAFPWRGQMMITVDDWAQDIFAAVHMVPRQAVHLDDADYLHVSFETTVGPSDRRYSWISLCGAQAAGGTFDADGHVRGRMSMSPFFYAQDGLAPYVEGWNCLQVFPFEGGYYELDGSKPETSVRVIVNRSSEGVSQDRDNVVNVGPPAYGADDDCSWCGFYRALDDLQRTAPRIRFDMYVRRDRVILYADGEQKLCNDFPGVPLTMAEGALGLGQVLYHSTAERSEFHRDDWVRDGQRYYLTNTPWADQRGWDNVGIEEGVAAPGGFDPASCWVSERQ